MIIQHKSFAPKQTTMSSPDCETAATVSLTLWTVKAAEGQSGGCWKAKASEYSTAVTNAPAVACPRYSFNACIASWITQTPKGQTYLTAAQKPAMLGGSCWSDP